MRKPRRLRTYGHTEEYPTAWGTDASEANPGEILFEIVNTTTESPGNESMGYLTSPKGYQDMCITAQFLSPSVRNA